MDFGFGVAGVLDPAIIAELASVVEAAGYTTLWVNDTPTGDSLAGCAAALAATITLRVGTGVIPVDRRDAAAIVAAARERDIDPTRLTLGIGSGQSKRPLATVRGAVEELREAIPEARIAVGALGPKMTALGATTADEVLLNWLAPAGAVESAAIIRGEAASASVAVPRVTLYVRVATDPDAMVRLREEAERYGTYPAYAASFQRFGVTPLQTTVGTSDVGAARAGLAAYAGAIDEVVIRAITPSETLGAYRDLADHLAPGNRSSGRTGESGRS